MKYIAISCRAVDELISDRLLQSIDFENGQTLAFFLQGQIQQVNISIRIRIVPALDAFFMLTHNDDSKKYLVIDTERSDVFALKYKPHEALLHFQKTLRFCAKMWNNLRPSANELFLTTSTKAVVFPYPISQQTALRISIELAPDSKRLSKRGEDRRYTLVYRCGTSEGGGPQERVSLTNFRRFLEAVPTVGRMASVEQQNGPLITSLVVTTLQAPPAARLSIFQGYERWLELLTRNQKEFVCNELRSPHRIEGPAGTGKTLCLILKCLASLKRAETENRECRSLFITHSDATRRTIMQVFEANDERSYLHGQDEWRAQSLNLTTVHHLCGDLLRQDIAESEFIDRDALESKQLQLLYISEAVKGALCEDLPTHQRFLSFGLNKFLSESDPWTISEMVQHEISVVIKGRAGEKLDNYRKCPPLQYGVPAVTESDRGFIWMIFKRYQKQLEDSAQFDTDDVVLTTIGQLNTPIWRRRRIREGYDQIFIDETHLFNLNELSLFHHLPRNTTQFPIAYSVDRSQAIGDRGWSDSAFDTALSPYDEYNEGIRRTEIAGVFRCSAEIVDLAFSVTSAGATLFTNFSDPLQLARSMFTSTEERKCAKPVVIFCANDSEMVEAVFIRADKLADAMDVPRSGIAIVAFSSDLFKETVKYANEHNKPVELLKERGDFEVVQRALSAGRFVLTLPDYVGGLEFDGVILLGVDDGRVPPAYTFDSADSRNFLSYASHNKLYVALTRARYRVEVLASRERGLSPLLKNAFGNSLLVECVL